MIDLITDRTESDVLLGNEKGQYTYVDLNRVESAVAELAALAVQLDVHLDLITKTDWTLPGAFSADAWNTEFQMQRYINNVHALCDALETSRTGVPSGMGNLTHIGANAIERALQAAYERVDAILQTFRYSGGFYAGEEIAL